MRPLCAALALVACSEPLPPDDYVDLDVVLGTWEATLADLDRAAAPTRRRPAATPPSLARDRLLLTALDAALRDAGPTLQVPGPLAATFERDGALQGFVDQDGDGAPTPGEPLVFRLVADLDRRRVLAVDLEHPRWMRALALPEDDVGLATAYALGRMRHAQEQRGVHTDSFGAWQVAPAGYHAGIENARRSQATD